MCGVSSNCIIFKIYGADSYVHARFVSHMCHDAYVQVYVGVVKVTLAERCQFHTIVQVYKILNHLVPAYQLQNTLMFAKDFTGFVGRDRYRLFIPRMKITFGQKSLFYRGAVAWKNIDQTLYSKTSL